MVKAGYHIFNILFFLCCFDTLNAQESVINSEYAYKKYDIENGLPTSKVICLGKDSNGFVWIGTYAGLCRFDGFNFELVDSTKFSILRIENFSQNEIRAYASDGYNVLDMNGLNVKSNVYSKQKLYLNFTKSRTLPMGYGLYEDETGSSKKLCFAKDSNLIVVTSSPYLDKINSWTLMPFFYKEKKLLYIPLIDEYAVITESGKLIISEKGIQLYSFVRWKNEVYAIGYDGIYKEDANNKFKLFFSYPFRDDFNGAYAITDRDNNLIIKDATSLYRFNGKSLEVICKGLNIVREILFDREGNLWVGTNSGLYNFFQLDFKRFYVNADNQMFSSVVSIEKDSTVWFSDYQSEIFSYRNNQLRRYSGAQIQHRKHESDLSFSSRPSANPDFAIIPMGTVDFYKIQNGKLQRIQTEIPVKNTFFSSAILPNNNLVLLSYNEICIVNQQGKLIQHFTNEGIDSRFIDVVADSKGRIWVAGQDHISLIENGKIENIPYKEVFSTIPTIIKDSKDKIWFISEYTLYQIDNKKISTVMKINGECNMFTITKSGLFVFACKEGILIYNPNNKKEVKYDKYNGFTGIEPDYKRISEDVFGNLWLHSLKGLFVFNPDRLLRAQPKPSLLIQSVQVSDDNVKWSNASLDSLYFNYKQNSLIIKYLGLSYSQAQNVRYQYRLIGFQDKWSQPVTEREIMFNNLAPGHYTFEIKCNTEAPEAQTDMVSLPIYIKPAFWQTWFFRILIFLLVAALIAWLAIRWQRKKHQYELRKANREKEINELRVQSVRLKSIPHFNSNVLAGIEYFIMTKSKEEANELLTTYSRFTNITLYDIDKAQRSLKDELDYVRMYLRLEKMRYGDKLLFSIDMDRDVDDKIMIPNMVLHTFVENAIKHGIRGKNSAGKVQIKIISEDKGIRLSVEDDGVGRSESAKRNIEQNRQGHGLTILSRQIELYNQQNEEIIAQKIVDLKDKEGNATGTRFEMYVPYDFKYI